MALYKCVYYYIIIIIVLFGLTRLNKFYCYYYYYFIVLFSNLVLQGCMCVPIKSVVKLLIDRQAIASSAQAEGRIGKN